MVVHWRRSRESGRMLRLTVNAVGAAATAIALCIIVVAKWSHGAWITALIIPAFVLLFRRVRRYNDSLSQLTRTEGPLDTFGLSTPIVVIPLRRLDSVGRKALRFAMTISPRVHVVQILAEELDTEDLDRQWREVVAEPSKRAGLPEPQLVVLRSPYRQFYRRLLDWIHQLTAANPGRHVVVLLPELVHRRWYQFVVNHRVTHLKAKLLIEGGPHVSVMSTPWYPDLTPAGENP
jgi:hypothetical protein